MEKGVAGANELVHRLGDTHLDHCQLVFDRFDGVQLTYSR
jgi:hypothetical protein